VQKRTGDRYGPFEVLERLGVGGMATVHRAIERGIEGFEREVALKRLLPHLAEDEAFLRLFVREAKLASILQHGNIVQLYELGRVGPSYFISMEYIAGRDLRAAIRQARRVVGPPPLAITLAIVAELLDALDYAHNRRDEAGEPLGIVHRDISPSNLLIGETGHLKVIDFGVAKATQGQLQSQTGGLKGKLSYMPPEMLAGRPLDGRSDLFSASIIAHELLTTTALFTGDSEFQTMDRVQHMTPEPPSARNPECTPEVDAIVLKGLAKEPDERWSSAAEMRAAVAELVVKSRQHATSREVAGWFEWAFGSRAVRRALPLTAELTPSESAAPSDSDPDSRRIPVILDEVEFEAAWEGLHSAAAPILLAEVPDVSDRLVALSPAPDRASEPDDDAPTLALELPPEVELIPLVEGRALRPEARQRVDSVLALAGPAPISALAWADVFVAGAAGSVSGPAEHSGEEADQRSVVAAAVAEVRSRDVDVTVPLVPAWMSLRRPPRITPVEWADGTEPESAAVSRDQLVLRAPPDPVVRPAAAPITLGDPLGAPLGRWRASESVADVRLRPSALRAFFIFLVASVAITAGTAYVLRGDHPLAAKKTGAAAPAPAATRAPESETNGPAAAPAPPEAPALVPPDRVKRKRGKRPVLRVAETGQTPDLLDTELCVDRRGHVASVKILTPVSDAARAALTRALGRWRYSPIRQDGERVAGCFAAQVRPDFE